MTCHWIRPNVRHIGILHLVSISTTSPQSICHSAPVSEVLSKSHHSVQKKMMSCRFSRWRISTILDFRDPIVGSVKSPCTTSYRSSMETVALNCLVFGRNSRFCIFTTDRQTNRQTDKRTNRWTSSMREAAARDSLINERHREWSRTISGAIAQQENLRAAWAAPWTH